MILVAKVHLWVSICNLSHGIGDSGCKKLKSTQGLIIGKVIEFLIGIG